MDNELQALSLVKEIQQCHEMTTSKVAEGFDWCDKCGELLTQAKAVLKVDKSTTFGAWIDQFLPFSERTAQLYMKLHKDLGQITKAKRAALFREAGSVAALQKMLNPPKKKRKTITGDTGGGGGGSDSLPVSEPELLPPEEEVQEEDEVIAEAPSSAGTPPRKYEPSFWLNEWDKTIGPLVRLASRCASDTGDLNNTPHRSVKTHLQNATDAFMEWMEGKQ